MVAHPLDLGTVLIVDDNPVVVTVLTHVLKRHCAVVCASGVAEAKAQLDAAAPDVVLADYQLADGVGTEVLAYAREIRPGALRLLMSGSELERLEEWIAQGLVAGFLAKPFSAPAFLQRVASLRAAPSPLGG